MSERLNNNHGKVAGSVMIIYDSIDVIVSCELILTLMSMTCTKYSVHIESATKEHPQESAITFFASYARKWAR